MSSKEPVGTEMSRLIPSWAVQFKGGCGCKDMQRKMDSWGADGCEKRRDQIVAHLLSQSDHLIPAFRFIPDTAKRALAGKMLTISIINAKKEQKRP